MTSRQCGTRSASCSTITATCCLRPMAPARVVKAMKLGAWNYVTKPWENDELVELVQQAAQERKAGPGVLLICDDPATLAPLQLALERQVRVSTIGVAVAATCGFRAKV